jgi:hypothetical protein
MEKLLISPQVVNGVNRWTVAVSNVPDSMMLFRGADIAEQLDSVKNFASAFGNMPDLAMDFIELPVGISDEDKMEMGEELLETTDELIIQGRVVLSAADGQALESVADEIAEAIIEFFVDGV